VVTRGTKSVIDFLTGPSFQEGRGSGACAAALPRQQQAATNANISSRMWMKPRATAGIVSPCRRNTGGILFPMNEMSKAPLRDAQNSLAGAAVPTRPHNKTDEMRTCRSKGNIKVT